MPTWRASPSSSQHLRCFVFPNAVICVASEHKADSPEVQPCFLGWRRRWWGLGKLGSAGQRKCAGNRGDASVRGPCSRSSSVVGVVGPDTARPHAQLSSQEGPCALKDATQSRPPCPQVLDGDSGESDRYDLSPGHRVPVGPQAGPRSCPAPETGCFL